MYIEFVMKKFEESMQDENSALYCEAFETEKH